VDLRLCSTEVRTKAVPVLLRILEAEAKVTKDVQIFNSVADPDPDQSKNSGALEVQNEAMEGLGRSHWMRGCSKLERWRVCRPVVADAASL
jgi:hypothetical protein